MASCLRPLPLAPRWCVPGERLEVLFEELAELTGQRNAIDGRIVEIVAEMDRDELWGATGARSVAALVAWKTGSRRPTPPRSPPSRAGWRSFPAAPQGMREGRLSLDQVGVIAERAGEGSDEHYAELAAVATVNQLRTAVKLEPRPRTRPVGPNRSARSPRPPTSEFTCWRITLAHAGRGEVRCGPAVTPRCADRRVEARPRQRATARIRSSAAAAGHRRGVHAAGRGRLGRRGGPPPPRAAHHRGGASRRQETASPRCIWARCSPRPNAAT